MDLAGEFKRIGEFGCHVLIPADAEYPPLLRQIYDPPIVLYVRGRLSAKDKNAVAMVGSRMTTHYGIEIRPQARLSTRLRRRHRRQRRRPRH